MSKTTKQTKNNGVATKAGSNGSSNKYGTPGNTGTERTWDLPWCDKKVAIIKALKALKATTPSDALSSTEVAAKAGVSQRDVRHYCYHAAAGDLVGITKVEGKPGHCFYLTKRGASVDPIKELKAQRLASVRAKAPAAEPAAV